VRDVLERHHDHQITDALVVEQAVLRPLPAAPVPSCTTYRPQVRR